MGTLTNRDHDRMGVEVLETLDGYCYDVGEMMNFTCKEVVGIGFLHHQLHVPSKNKHR